MKTRTRAEKTIIIVNTILLLLVILAVWYFFEAPWLHGSLFDDKAASAPRGIKFYFALMGPGEQSPKKFFWRPLGIARDLNENLYIADTNNRRVCVFDPRGRFLFEFGSSGIANPGGYTPSTWRGGQFAFPYGIDVAMDGRIYVADMLNGRIQYFTPSGDFIDYFPKEKSIDSRSALHRQMLHPQALKIVKDLVYVCDSFRVAVFTLDGELVKSFGRQRIGATPGNLDHPNGVAVGADGTVYVADSNNFRIQAFDQDNKVKWILGGPNKDTEIGIPRGIAIDKRGNLLVIDALISAIHVISPQGDLLDTLGERGANKGFFNFPNDLVVRSDGKLYIADKENNRVQMVELSYK